MRNIAEAEKNILKDHVSGDGVKSTAIYSPCEQYRYMLSRQWDDSGKGPIAFLMLNPSTATEIDNDPTVERCEQRARKLGYDGFKVLNLFAIRATNPREMLAHQYPNGRDNDQFIKNLADGSIPVVFAWGNHGRHMGRSFVVRQMFSGRDGIYYLKRNGSGEPAHPLYLGYSEALKPWCDHNGQ